MTFQFSLVTGFSISCDGDHGFLDPPEPYRDTDPWWPSAWHRMMAAGWMIKQGEQGPIYLCRGCSGKARRGANR